MHDAVSLSMSQFSRAWRQFAAANPGSLVENGPGVEYVLCGLPIPFFNVVLLTEPRLTADALASHARAASERVSGTALPWMLLVTAELGRVGVDASLELRFLRVEAMLDVRPGGTVHREARACLGDEGRAA